MKTAPNLDLLLLARQWGARSVPFGELTPEAWLESPAQERALSLLQQSASLRSLMLLAGPNGVGKSALVGRWVQSLDRRLFAPLVFTHASVTGSSLLAALTAKLGKPPSARREINVSQVEKALEELGRVVPVIVLDEAQNYPPGSLEEVRLLLGLNLAQPPAFALILVGDEYLLNTLRLRHYRALCSRIGAYHQLRAWTAAQGQEYLQQGLRAVGLTPELWDPAAVGLLTSASGGLARSLCLLARAAWISAASAGAQRISAEHVQAALELVPVPTLAPPALEGEHGN
jgi:type II secretory pathway predicted ATPase ExeA